MFDVLLGIFKKLILIHQKIVFTHTYKKKVCLGRKIIKWGLEKYHVCLTSKINNMKIEVVISY